MVVRRVALALTAMVIAGSLSGCVQPPSPPTTTSTTTTSTTTTTTTLSALPVPGTCFESSNPSQADILYNGPIDTYDNVRVYTSTDGTCTGSLYGGGPPSFVRSWVHATSSADASTKCASLSTPSSPQTAPVSTVYTAVPADVWSCSPNPPALVEPAAGCYDSSRAFQADVFYNGTPNVMGNLVFHTLSDGTCNAPAFPTDQMLVVAASQAAADGVCQGAGRQSSYPADDRDYGYVDIGPDAYICTSD